MIKPIRVMNKSSTKTVAMLTSSVFFTGLVAVTFQQNQPVQAFPSPLASRSSLSSSKYVTSKLRAEKRPGNPLQTLIGDMASSLASSISGGGVSNSNLAELDSNLKSTVSSSWEDIRSDLESKQTPDERAFRSNVKKGIGPASPLHKIRLFDESNKEEDIRVTLYRDHASWCPVSIPFLQLNVICYIRFPSLIYPPLLAMQYCQKVWMFLEEKRIPYRIEKINMRCYGEKPASFQRLQPSGAIPVAIIDGRTLNQSNDIIYTLEELFTGGKQKSMLPPQDDSAKRMKAQQLLKLERSLFSAWMSYLTGSSRSKGSFINVLGEVENELKNADGDFFLGNEVSLVDCMYAPFLERIAASMIFFKGLQIRVPKGAMTDYPAINRWFDAMETLESYTLTKGDYYSHCWDLPPQLGGCVFEDGGGPYEQAINGEKLVDGSRGSWELPIEPHLGGVEPDWHWCGDENAAKREAVERLSYNHGAIVSFAARGAGKKGLPPYSAALSDPNAVPNDSVKTSVDACLSIVCLALLNGVDSVADDLEKIVMTLSKQGGPQHVENVIASLAYLRDRIGVPRDMRLPAATQLRAHINYVIGKMM